MGSPFVCIGLTGGVGSGKSAVAELLRQTGIDVINLDDVGRELTESNRKVVDSLVKLFGPSVLNDGIIDRSAVRKAIFADAEKRARLEAFLHPLIWEEFQRRCHALAKAGKKLVVCEAALLIEGGLHHKLDGLVLVTAPEDLRRQRVIDRDKISALLVEQMFRAQLRDSDRLTGNTTTVIENSGSLGELTLKVSHLLEEWRTKGWIESPGR